QGQGSLAKGRDKRAFQEFYDEYDRIQPFRTVNGSRWTDVICNAPISYKGQAAVQMDIENLQAATAGVGAEEAFITAVAPGSIITRRVNKYYSSEEAFLFAIAEAMKTEYKAIVDGGFLLQIDDPQLVTRYDMEDPPPNAEQYRKLAEARVEALNHALADIPQDRVRYHICWGGWHGPHTTDFAAKRYRQFAAPDTRRRLLDRGRQCASRARVARVGAGKTSAREDTHPRGCQSCDQRRRTSGAGSGAHPAFRQLGRSRKCHCRHRLWPRRPAAPPACLGQVRGIIRRRAVGDQADLGP